jgi:hypothetical protein
MTNRQPMTVRLSDEERDFLRESAEEDDRTSATQIRHLIKQDRVRRQADRKPKVKEMS